MRGRLQAPDIEALVQLLHDHASLSMPRVGHLHYFLDPALFPRFGPPPRL